MRFSAGSPIARGYLLLLATGLYAWPVTLGMPQGILRLVWITVSFPLLICSAWIAHRAMQRSPLALAWRPMPWRTIICLLGAISLPLGTIPIHAFTDEPLLAAPALTVVSRIAASTGWLTLLLCTGLALSACWLIVTRLSLIISVFCAAALAVFAAVIALTIPEHSILAVRYPPMVHVVQALGTILSGGTLAWVRLPNLLWIAGIAVAVWQLPTGWSIAQRWVVFLALLLGPIGWIYHVSLYQACGEITIGLAVVLALDRLLQERTDGWAAMTGMLLGGWLLYRPTALSAVIIILGLLLVLRRFIWAGIVAGIALPIAALWLSLYPLYGYAFLLKGGRMFPAASGRSMDLATPLLTALHALPRNFGWVTLALLAVSSILVMARGTRAWRRVVLLAWTVGLATAAAQQMILPPEYYGFPRYNILLMLPLALGIAALPDLRIPRRYGFTLAGAALLMLIAATPFDATLFMQRNHLPGVIPYQWTAGADEPLPVATVALQMIEQGLRPVIVGPDSSFLELAVARGMLTPAERTRMIRLGETWTPASPARPVLVQAPVQTTYTPNTTPAQEQHLRSTRTWALAQPNHRIVRLGIEEVVIVP